VFGPGRGECVLVHLGNNEWCVIDSCIARGSGQPVAMEYLNSFQNRAVGGIRLIVATHWHDDHIHGLAAILREAPNARFACSGALDEDIFRELVALSEFAVPGRSGVAEFASIFELLIARQEQGAQHHLVSPMYALSNRKLLSLQGSGRPFPVGIISLSPSDGTVTAFYWEIAKLMPNAGDAQRRIVSQPPNHTSVAIWIEAGQRRALLGADLEHTGKPGEGWMAVVASNQQTVPAAIFKVPHHGSANGDYSQVWTQLLKPEPIAVVTPFTAGVRLPKKSDLDRLCSRTPHVYCTVEGAGKPPSRDPSVEREMRRFAKNRRVLQGQPGHVRIRWSTNDLSATPSIDLFNGARKVSPH
jgi:beta-lactamase superfamily II metal-dependent hydrolase